MPQSAEARSAEPVFEGTWDELLGHSQEFAGKKLRLTVISSEDGTDTIEQF